MALTHVPSADGWTGFQNVEQDKEGVVLTTGGGLYTRNLSNCMCLILTDGSSKVGMLHASPDHPNTAMWVKSLIKEVGATTAVVTGANVDIQDDKRKKELETLLSGLREVVDETQTGWVPGGANRRRGNNKMRVGSVAVNATTKEYALHMADFPNLDTLSAPAHRSSRNSGCGGCTII